MNRRSFVSAAIAAATVVQSARFIAAMRETSIWANANRSLTAPMLAKATRIPLDVVQRMRRGAFAVNNDQQLVQPVIDAVVRYGIIEKGFPAGELIYK